MPSSQFDSGSDSSQNGTNEEGKTLDRLSSPWPERNNQLWEEMEALDAGEWLNSDDASWCRKSSVSPTVMAVEGFGSDSMVSFALKYLTRKTLTMVYTTRGHPKPPKTWVCKQPYRTHHCGNV